MARMYAGQSTRDLSTLAFTPARVRIVESLGPNVKKVRIVTWPSRYLRRVDLNCYAIIRFLVVSLTCTVNQRVEFARLLGLQGSSDRRAKNYRSLLWLIQLLPL